MEYTLVRRAVRASTIDGADLDNIPDLVNATGKVSFTPALGKGDVVQVTEPGGGMSSIVLKPIEASVSDGLILHRGQEGVKLFAGGPNSNPTTIRWKAQFKHMQADGWSFDLKPVIFDAVPGGEVDLTLVAPLAGLSSTIVRGPAGASLHDVALEGAELVVTVSDDQGVRELRRIPLENIQRAENAAGRAETAATSAEDAADRAEAGAAVVGDAQTVLDARDTAVDAADRAEIAAAAVAFTEDPAGSGLYTFPTTAGA